MDTLYGDVAIVGRWERDGEGAKEGRGSLYEGRGRGGKFAMGGVGKSSGKLLRSIPYAVEVAGSLEERG